MNQLTKLQEHYRMLQVEERLLFDDCDWDNLAQVRMALDDTLEQIQKLNKGL